MMLTAVPLRGVKSMEERKEEQDRQAFVDDINYFCAKEQFNLYDFHERVLNALKQKSSVKMMIWGDDAEVKVLESQNKVCSAMYEHEKTETRLSTESKKEIAEAAQVPLSDVEDVLQKHKQLCDFHLWLLSRKERGDPMPESREELMQIYKIERPSFLTPKMHKKSYSRRQTKYSMRRHYT